MLPQQESKKNPEEKDEESFDAGELWSWINTDITISDFKNSIIDEESMRYLAITVEQKRYGQRFAIVSVLEKKAGKPPVFHTFFQPSVPVTNIVPKAMENAEAVYGKGNVVRPSKNIPGIVHQETLALRIKKAHADPDKKSVAYLLELEQLELDEELGVYKIGSSCIFTEQGFEFLNRSGFIMGMQRLNFLGSLAFMYLYPNINPSSRAEKKANFYDAKQHDFFGKEYTLSYHLKRSVPEEVMNIIMMTMSAEINKRLISTSTKESWGFSRGEGYPDDPLSVCYSYTYRDIWNQELRFNKLRLAEKLQETIYIATAYREEKSGEDWDIEDEEGMIIDAMISAKENDITLNFNIIPEVFKDFNLSITPLMFAAKKGMRTLIPLLLASGADFSTKDDKGDDALEYAKAANHELIAAYLKTIAVYYDAFKNNRNVEVRFILNTSLYVPSDIYINIIEKPLFKSYTLLALAASEKNIFNLSNVLIALEKNPSKKIIDLPLTSSKVTALFIAAKSNNVANVFLLLSAGADPEKVLMHRDFEMSIQNKEIINLLQLFEEKSITPKQKSDPFALAAKIGSIELIKILLKNGYESSMALEESKANKNVGVYEYLFKVTQLPEAVENGKELKAFSEDKDIDIARTVSSGLTSLALAATLENPNRLLNVMQALKSKTSNLADSGYLDIPTPKFQRTPLFVAALNNRVHNVLLLLRAGANPRLVLEHPQYPYTIKNVHARYFLNKFSNPNSVQKDLINLVSNLNKITLLKTTESSELHADIIAKLRMQLADAKCVAEIKNLDAHEYADPLIQLWETATQLIPLLPSKKGTLFDSAHPLANALSKAIKNTEKEYKLSPIFILEKEEKHSVVQKKELGP